MCILTKRVGRALPGSGTGKWLPGRKVLISPASIAPEGTADEAIRVHLTRAQVEAAPETGEDPPISQMLEAAHAAAGKPGETGGTPDGGEPGGGIALAQQRGAITDMVVDTRSWLPGRKVLVRPEVIEAVDWQSKQVSMRVTREELKRSPEPH